MSECKVVKEPIKNLFLSHDVSKFRNCFLFFYSFWHKFEKNVRDHLSGPPADSKITIQKNFLTFLFFPIIS